MTNTNHTDLSNFAFLRKLFSEKERCNAGCEYCFAKWNELYHLQPFLEFESEMGEGNCILYPCCDGEILRCSSTINNIKKLSTLTKHLYISFSTKTEINEEVLRAIIKLNDYLVRYNKGFVKIGISLSTKSLIEEIESGTLTYNDRLFLATKLLDSGINTSVILKPILPFVQTEEYFEIIDDYSKILNRLLVGGLYVNKSTFFYNSKVKGKYKTIEREVKWLPNCPVWSYVDEDDKIEEIREYAVKCKMRVFDTDVDIIKSFIKDD